MKKTNGWDSAHPSPPPPVLILGLGNLLLSDDGVGPAILAELRRTYGNDDGCVEFLDGGTQGLNLLGCLGGRQALIILDALQLGKGPGTVSVLRSHEAQELPARRSTTAHEGNAGELLAAAALLGELPQQVFVVGVEPERLSTGLGLSEPVQAAVPQAAARAQQLIAEFCRVANGSLFCNEFAQGHGRYARNSL